MASFNKCILMGHITRDIELRYIPSGTAVAEVGLAVNDKRKNANNEWVEEVSFFDCVFWGRTAEVANEYLHKGSPILVEGRLKQDTWEKDGQKKSKVRVIVERMQMVGGKNGGGHGGNGGSGGGGHSDGGPSYSDEEIPF